MDSPETKPGFGSKALFVSSGMMEEVPEYGAWIAKVIGTSLKGSVLEVGCGYGMYSNAYAARPDVSSVLAIDLSADAIAGAEKKPHSSKVMFKVQDAFALTETFDSIVCANVLEHIQDDVSFCRSLLKLLKPGGTLVMLVPAHMNLYSRYDLEAGHYRRYTKKTLRRTLESAGAIVDRLFSFSLIGALGWWWAFKVKGDKEVDESKTRGMLRLYRNIALPLSQMIESLIPVPFGLSVVACCHNRRAHEGAL